MTATKLSCGSCGTVLNEKARFCSECGAAVLTGTPPAEYKQVTVLFADVVHSMDIAGAVGAERLREIMAELVNISATVVKRYGGTVDKFTGDGIVRASTPRTPQVEWWLASCLAELELELGRERRAAAPEARRARSQHIGRPKGSMRRKLNWPAGCMQAVSRRAR
jgi:adenylate cyclase